MTEVSVDIDASPQAVYDLVADLPAMGRWSPECYRCDWQDGATAAAPGVRFLGRNRIGVRRWSTQGTVVVADPGRELTFDVSYLGLPVARWSYRIAPRPEGGVTLTESTQDRRGPVVSFLGSALLIGTPGADRKRRNEDTMAVTLRRLKEAAEQAAAVPAQGAV
jgi:uncharacterized protein YndB with AHSA1/START domain